MKRASNTDLFRFRTKKKDVPKEEEEENVNTIIMNPDETNDWFELSDDEEGEEEGKTKKPNEFENMIWDENPCTPPPQESIPISSVPITFVPIPLKNYQYQGVQWMKKREKEKYKGVSGGIFADDMGLGKTRQVLQLVYDTMLIRLNRNEYDHDVTVVVMNKMLIQNWKKEIRKHLPSLRYLALDEQTLRTYRTPTRASKLDQMSKEDFLEVLSLHDVVLISYNQLQAAWAQILEKIKIKCETEIQTDKKSMKSLQKDSYYMAKSGLILGEIRSKNRLTEYNSIEVFHAREHLFLNGIFKRIVLDEAHIARNSKSGIFEAIDNLNARFKWWVSGTPLQNGLEDLYAALRFLRLNHTESLKAWKKKYRIQSKKIQREVLQENKKQETLATKKSRLQKSLTQKKKRKYKRSSNGFRQEEDEEEEEEEENEKKKKSLADQKEEEEKQKRYLDIVQGQLKNILDSIMLRRIASDIAKIDPTMKPNVLNYDVVRVDDFIDEEERNLHDGLFDACQIRFREESKRKKAKTKSKAKSIVPNLSNKQIRGRSSSSSFSMGLPPSSVFIPPASSSSSSSSFLLNGFRSKGKEEDEDEDEEEGDDSYPLKFVAPDNLDDEKDTTVTKSGASNRQLLTFLMKMRQCCYIPHFTSSKIEGFPTDAWKKVQSIPLHRVTKIAALLAGMTNVPEEDSGIVFTQWTYRMQDVANVIEEYNPHGKKCYVLKGDMSEEERWRVLDEFETHYERTGKGAYMVANLMIACFGLTLTFANWIFLTDIWWNPKNEDQAIKRVDRLGQTKPVHIMKFVVDNTIEAKILKKQTIKNLLSDIYIQKDSIEDVGEKLKEKVEPEINKENNVQFMNLLFDF